MPFQIIRSNITKVKADAIVNTANPEPVVGGGTDRAIYNAAGKDALLAERKEIGRIEPGDAVYTDAFALNAKYIIHTVGPSWIDGRHGEEDILRSCYEKSLALADYLKCKSIAFPLIATGVYGFPKDQALEITLSVISRFLLTHDLRIIIAVFDRNSFVLSSSVVGDIEQYIDDHGVDAAFNDEYGENARRRLIEEERRRVSDRIEKISNKKEKESDALGIYASTFPDVSGKTLDEVIGGTGSSFRDKLFELIDKSGMDDVTVYKKANIDRKVFSSIKCKKDYKPKKITAVAFAIALRLDMTEMTDLLAHAGIALSPSDKFDLIISYFITNKKYDIYEINAVLFKYNLPTIGC